MTGDRRVARESRTVRDVTRFQDLELWSEEFCEEGQDVHAGGLINLALPFDESALVYSPDLIENDLTGFAFESNRYAGGVGPTFRRHGGDDDRVDMTVHFVGRDDEARAGFADLPAFGWIQSYKKYIETGGYHFQSFRSHLEVDEASRSTSSSSPCRCTSSNA